MRCLAPALLPALCYTLCLAYLTTDRNMPLSGHKGEGPPPNDYVVSKDDDDNDYNKSRLEPCQSLEKGVRVIPGGLNMTRHDFYKNELLALIWEEEEERLAAALLRARVIAAGYNGQISLYSSKHLGLRYWKLVRVRSLQWRVRLTPHAHAIPLCKNASFWSFYEDNKNLRDCDFIEDALNIRSGHTNAYMVSDWQHLRAAEQVKQLAASSFEWVNFVHIDSSYLWQLLRNSNYSFLFYDVNNWSKYAGVHIVQLPPCASCISSAFENTFLLEGIHVEEILEIYDHMFARIMLSPSTLRKVTKIASQNDITVDEAACLLVQQTQKQVKESHGAAFKAVLLFICEIESARNLEEYFYLISVLESFLHFKVHVYYMNCLNTDSIIRKLQRLSDIAVLNIVGVIVTDHLATAATLYAETLKFPLLTYDVSIGTYKQTNTGPVASSVTGNLTHLELGLRRLLADCGWRRLAVLSDQTRLAKALATALCNPNAGLIVREYSLNSTLEINNVLKELVDVKTQVFLVNTEETMAAVILAAAVKLNITRDAGYIWIVREYYAADNATAVIKPYSVSFWRRGDWTDKVNNMIETDMQDKVVKTGDDDKKNQDGTRDVDVDVFKTLIELQKQLESRWRSRAWPLHAAPIVDAILTLQNMYDEILRILQWDWNYSRYANPTKSVLWNFIQNRKVSGINQNLEYDNYGNLKSLLVFVQQWDAEPQPRVLATWLAGQWRESAETCPATDAPSDDGSVHCLVPVGDPFNPSCQDAIWIASAVLAVILSAALINTAVNRSRQALAARDQRVKTEFAKRMLARRERVFAALAAHLVDRSAIELKQELGTGRFGVVRLGLLRTPDNGRRTIVVATKALREEASPTEESEFLMEACTLASFEHDHIVRFVGVCVVDGPPLLLMEHAFFGDLLRYLQERRYIVEKAKNAETASNEFMLEEKMHVSSEALTRLAREAAAALAYIAQRGIVHRDVRASNCLVDERRSLKLGDFGLARTIGTIDGEYASHRRGLFPVLWMAPESLATGVFSAASDVWSFGVLVFELVTLGRRPYGAQPPPSVLRHVVAGGRPQLPWDASAETRALVRSCWRSAPESRPAAARLAEWLTERQRALCPALAPELVEVNAQGDGRSESIGLDTLPCFDYE